MNIEQLQYLATIARTGSISTAAEILHVSQAGISKSIIKLEKEFGFELFKRSRQGTVPTDRGRVIIQKANEIIAKLEEIEAEVSEQVDHIRGEIRMSVSPNYMAILPHAILSFKEDNPYVKLEVHEKDSVDIIDDIKHSRIDLGLIYLNRVQPEQSRDLVLVPMIHSRLVACVSKHSWLATRSEVTPKELKQQAFVSTNGSLSTRFMEQFTERYGAVNTIFKSNNQEVLKRTIAEGAAVGVFIEFSLLSDPLIESGEIVAVPLEKELNETITLGYAYSKNQKLSKAHQELLKYVEREIELIKQKKVGAVQSKKR
ncbi:LysR family transcriptional regulator [Paenibacillus sp. NPDC058071]|uniref:LysR family transcriptional regulator n=1 Tax=Paenibacillus sp. NPDC058071 TaxID=3346326 RepID=UPI0036DEE920